MERLKITSSNDAGDTIKYGDFLNTIQKEVTPNKLSKEQQHKTNVFYKSIPQSNHIKLFWKEVLSGRTVQVWNNNLWKEETVTLYNKDISVTVSSRTLSNIRSTMHIPDDMLYLTGQAIAILLGKKNINIIKSGDRLIDEIPESFLRFSPTQLAEILSIEYNLAEIIINKKKDIINRRNKINSTKVNVNINPNAK